MQKYQHLKREITVVVQQDLCCACGSRYTWHDSENFKQHLKTIGATVKVELLQKVALLGTERLLRKLLEA